MTHKRWVATLMLLWLMGSAGLALPSGGDGMGFLQKRDAERLEAFVLAENLVDFAARTNSARAYLMAVELRLLYPVRSEGDKATSVEELLTRARALAPNDAGVQDWAAQLAKLAAKSTRDEASFQRFELTLAPGQETLRSLPARLGGQRLLVMPSVARGQVETSVVGPDGRVLATTTEPGLYYETELPVTLRLKNAGATSLDLTVLYR